MCSDHLISPGPTTVHLHMQEHCPVCSDNSISPGLTTVPLHMQGHCSVCSDHLTSPGPTTQLLYMHEYCLVCSYHLMCPGPTTVLLHMQEHHFCVLRCFIVSCSNHSASVCRRTFPMCSDYFIFSGPTIVPLHLS